MRRMHLGDTKQQTSHLSAECVLQLTSYSEPDMVRILTNPFCHIYIPVPFISPTKVLYSH